MKTLFTALADRLAAGEAAVVCSVVAASGSTPRGAGAKMAVFADGTFAGTIGGGPVEHAALLRAREALTQRAPAVESFRLRPNDVADLGMICGGDVTVCFQPMGGEADLRRARAALALLDRREDSWLVTELRGGIPQDWGVSDGSGNAQFLAGADPAALRPLLRRIPALSDGEPRYFVEPLGSGAFVYVFGGGHVSMELVPLLSHLGFHTAVLENRAEFARPQRFPTADRVELTEFSDFAAATAVGPADCIVIMTRGHQDDYLVLQQALRTPAGYVGVIGSRRKAALTLERLRSDGFSERDLDRVHSPIGLPIGAETPAEIAVSVAAELIRCRARLAGRLG